MTVLTIAELSDTTIGGSGVFDVLMRANKAHLEQEFAKGRLKGPEYATVYLGSLQAVMQTALAFLLQKRKNDLEAVFLEKQIALTAQQTINAADELITAAAQRAKLAQEISNLAKQELQITQQTLLIANQTANAVIEGKVLEATLCKLKADFDSIMASIPKTNQETALLAQKTATEKAQVTGLGVDATGVIGRQNALYAAQASGYIRDAEQKAAKMLIDTWNVRRTTDDTTVAGVGAGSTINNFLGDADVGRAVSKLLTGVGA